MTFAAPPPLRAPAPPLGPDPSIVASGPTRLTRWLCASGAVGLAATGLGFVYLVDPNRPGNPYPGCILKQATGLDCPGCGGTRALHSLLHGDVAGALDHNVLLFLLLPLALYMASGYALSQFGVTVPALRARPWMAWVLLVVLGVFSVVRNLPGSPLYYLNSAAA